MKFPSRKGLVVIGLINFLIIMVLISFIEKAYIIGFILIGTLSYLIWMWFDTYYVIDGDRLWYRSALLRGSIDIHTIFEIVKNKKHFSGKKPSLSTKGIIIKYNKWDEIYMSPIDIDQFISALKNVNPGIKTIE